MSKPFDPAAEWRRERAEMRRERPPRMPTAKAVRDLVSLDGMDVVVRNTGFVPAADGSPAGVEVEETAGTLVVSADLLQGRQPRPHTQEDDHDDQ